jgi:hypothetical protein
MCDTEKCTGLFKKIKHFQFKCFIVEASVVVFFFFFFFFLKKIKIANFQNIFFYIFTIAEIGVKYFGYHLIVIRTLDQIL